MGLYDRPNGPVLAQTAPANQPGLNVQGGQAGPLPATQTISTNAETKLLSTQNTAVALSVALPPDTANEQTDLVLEVCGYIKTTNTGTIALGLYADASTLVVSSNLLHKTASSLPAQNSTTAPFSIRAIMRYDSVSGKLTGECKQSINNTLDPEQAFTNVPTGISNSSNPVAQFSLSITSSGAAAGTLTTIVVTKFSVG